ncbi:MAG: nucleotidyltransferase domain-containing protein [Burkholderiaceae bacterium]
MLKWPDRATVDAAVRALVAQWVPAHPELRRAGYFGSYARGDWGVGSDVDLVMVVERSARPFAERALDFDQTPLPVPADLLVYTEDEWRSLPDVSPRFARRLATETVWVL